MPGCGLGQSGEGAAALFSKGKIDFLLGGGDCLHFATGRSNSIAPPNRQHGQYDNQTKGGGVWAEMAGVVATLSEGIWDIFFG